MILGGLILLTVVVGLFINRPRPAALPSLAPSRWWRLPETWFTVVTLALFVNQVLLSIYILRIHDGNPAFVANYLPGGWFDIARWPWLEALARHFPAPELLGPTVLRVPSFLELPFGVLAYLMVCRWFSGDVYRLALRLVWPIALSWTAAFSLIEWHLWTPYSVQDIAIRCAVAIVLPLSATKLTRSGSDRPLNLAGLLIFAMSTAALGLLILGVYDVALLYNLGRLPARLPEIALPVLVLIGLRWATRFIPESQPGPGLDTIASSFGWFLVLFAVPALPIRYGLAWGARISAILGGLVVLGFSFLYGAKASRSRSSIPWRTWLACLTLSTVAGIVAALAALLLPAPYLESRILLAGSAFFLIATTVCAVLDHRMHTPRRCRNGREPVSSGDKPRDARTSDAPR